MSGFVRFCLGLIVVDVIGSLVVVIVVGIRDLCWNVGRVG